MNCAIVYITELGSILHQCHILGCEMVHFIQQTQYYINFEVRWLYGIVGKFALLYMEFS